jgi:hypothetical protein
MKKECFMIMITDISEHMIFHLLVGGALAVSIWLVYNIYYFAKSNDYSMIDYTSEAIDGLMDELKRAGVKIR